MTTTRAIAAALILLGCRGQEGPPAPAEAGRGLPAVREAVLRSPAPSAAAAEKPPFDHAIGSYVTRYPRRGKDAPRAKNVELAAKRLNGKVVAPGEELSFNDVVGVRSEAAGFVKAPVIFMGELTPDVGGGVCQVSSTVHAAALAAMLEVVQRLPHSRPAKYIMVGLDATVAFPPECGKDHRTNWGNGGNLECYSSDLVVKNPHPWPVRLTAESGPDVPEDGGKAQLVVTFWGRDPLERKVDFRSTFSWTDEFKRRTKPHPWRKDPGYARKVQEGARGRHATLTVVTERHGKVTEARYPSTYQPVDEVWEVGAGRDPGAPAPWEPQDAEASAEEAGQDAGGRRGGDGEPGEPQLPGGDAPAPGGPPKVHDRAGQEGGHGEGRQVPPPGPGRRAGPGAPGQVREPRRDRYPRRLPVRGGLGPPLHGGPHEPSVARPVRIEPEPGALHPDEGPQDGVVGELVHGRPEEERGRRAGRHHQPLQHPGRYRLSRGRGARPASGPRPTRPAC